MIAIFRSPDNLAAMPSYRKNVAAILVDHQGRILICERRKPDDAWQFPQGGVDKGETSLQALLREVEEEVGLLPEHYDVEYSRGVYRYKYPDKVSEKKGYRGQAQTYYLCRIKEGAPEPRIAKNCKEFKDYQWIYPCEFKRKWLPKFKEEVYEHVLWDFFDVEMKGNKTNKSYG